MNGDAPAHPRAARRGAVTSWLAIVLLGLTPLLRGEVEHLNTTDIVARFDAPWPGSLRRAYQPMFVQVGNRGAESREVAITVSGSYWKNRPFEVTDRVECAPGESVDRELVIPVPWDASVRVMIVDGTESSAAGMKVGIGEPDDRPAIVTFSTKSDAALQRLDNAMSDRGRLGFSSIGVLEFSHLPRRMASFSSLDLVAIDLAEATPDPDAIAALLAWARLGGSVLFTGRDREEIVSLLPACAPYLEGARTLAADGDLAMYPCGFGTIAVDSWNIGDAEGTGSERHHSLFNRVARNRYNRDVHSIDEEKDQWLRELSGRAIPLFAPQRIPPLSAPVDATPGRGVLVGVLFVFTMLVGPVSFFLARRRQAPILAFAYAPGFALAGSIAILAASVASTGLGVKSTSLTFTYLDQRIHRASVTEMRVMFSGLSRTFRLDGRFGLCIPDHDPTQFQRENWFPRARREQNDLTRVLDLTEGLDHSGGFAPPRRPVRQLVIVDEPARARLDFRLDGDSTEAKLVANNALGVSVEALFVRLGPDDLRALDAGAKPLTSGEVVSLARRAPPSKWRLGDLLGARDLDPDAPRARPAPGAAASPPEQFAEWLQASGRALHVGEYLAIVDAPVVAPDGGLDIDRVAEKHILLGAFELPVAGGAK